MDCWSRPASNLLIGVFLRPQLLIWMSSLTPWHPSFCEDMCVPTRTYLTFNNDKPWFSTKLKQLHQAKEDAYRSGDRALFKQAKYKLDREIRVAQKNYSEKLKNSFQATTLHKCGKAWKPSPATRHHPQHWGQSTTGWRSKRVLLQVWKAKPWSDIPHPLWHSHQQPTLYCLVACTKDL